MPDPPQTEADAHTPTGTHRTVVSALAIAALWCLLFAGVLALARAAVLAHYSDLGAAGHGGALATLVALPANFACAAVCAWPSVVIAGRIGHALQTALAAAVILLNLAGYYYEALTGDVATSSIFYYADQLDHLWPSVRHELIAWLPAATAALAGASLLSLRALARWASTRTWAAAVPAGLVLGVTALGATLGSGAFTLAPPLERARKAPLFNLFTAAHASPADLPSPADAAVEGASDSTTPELPEPPTPQDIARLQRMSGLAEPTALANPRYPYCRAAGARTASVPAATRKRSAILLILESVGRDEFALELVGQPVMPNLQRLAQRGLTFHDFIASGSKSGQAIPAIFAGVPPLPAGNVLWFLPVRALDGYPAQLAKAGYRTLYLHGGALNFENQKVYLQALGFEEIEGVDPRSERPMYGWGYSDGDMFATLRERVAEQRKQRPNEPYFATLFTLSTHHPYVLPDTHPRAFTEQDADVAAPARESAEKVLQFAESLRYLDTHLGAFVDWYMRNEAARGTVLLVVGDHAGRVSKARARERGHAFDSRTPLIVLGLDEREREQMRARTGRRGAHHDLPRTLAGLLGVPPGPCDQGVDLLAEDDDARLARRVVYSVAHEDLSEVNLWSERGVFAYDVRSSTLRPLQVDGIAAAPQDPAHDRELARFARDAMRLSMYLIRDDRLAPPQGASTERAVAPPAAQKLLIASHRGNVRGRAAARENTLAAIETAIAAGFEWVEIDLNLTADGELVLFHDNAVRGPDGRLVAVIELTLAQLRELRPQAPPSTLREVITRFDGKIDFLLEAKPQDQQIASQDLVRALVRTISETAMKSRYVVDSFDLMMAIGIADACACDVGFDLPANRRPDTQMLTALQQVGLKWLYLDAATVTEETIELVHSHGLRVMLYTINDPARLATWRAAPPDGVITDDRRVLEAAHAALAR